MPSSVGTRPSKERMHSLRGLATLACAGYQMNTVKWVQCFDVNEEEFNDQKDSETSWVCMLCGQKDDSANGQPLMFCEHTNAKKQYDCPGQVAVHPKCVCLDKEPEKYVCCLHKPEEQLPKVLFKAAEYILRGKKEYQDACKGDHRVELLHILGGGRKAIAKNAGVHDMPSAGNFRYEENFRSVFVGKPPRQLLQAWGKARSAEEQHAALKSQKQAAVLSKEATAATSKPKEASMNKPAGAAVSKPKEASANKPKGAADTKSIPVASNQSKQATRVTSSMKSGVISESNNQRQGAAAGKKRDRASADTEGKHRPQRQAAQNAHRYSKLLQSSSESDSDSDSSYQAPHPKRSKAENTADKQGAAPRKITLKKSAKSSTQEDAKPKLSTDKRPTKEAMGRVGVQRPRDSPHSAGSSQTHSSKSENPGPLTKLSGLLSQGKKQSSSEVLSTSIASGSADQTNSRAIVNKQNALPAPALSTLSSAMEQDDTSSSSEEEGTGPSLPMAGITLNLTSTSVYSTHPPFKESEQPLLDKEDYDLLPAGKGELDKRAANYKLHKYCFRGPTATATGKECAGTFLKCPDGELAIAMAKCSGMAKTSGLFRRQDALDNTTCLLKPSEIRRKGSPPRCSRFDMGPSPACDPQAIDRQSFLLATAPVDCSSEVTAGDVAGWVANAYPLLVVKLWDRAVDCLDGSVQARYESEASELASKFGSPDQSLPSVSWSNAPLSGPPTEDFSFADPGSASSKHGSEYPLAGCVSNVMHDFGVKSWLWNMPASSSVFLVVCHAALTWTKRLARSRDGGVEYVAGQGSCWRHQGLQLEGKAMPPTNAQNNGENPTFPSKSVPPSSASAAQQIFRAESERVEVTARKMLAPQKDVHVWTRPVAKQTYTDEVIRCISTFSQTVAKDKIIKDMKLPERKTDKLLPALSEIEGRDVGKFGDIWLSNLFVQNSDDWLKQLKVQEAKVPLPNSLCGNRRKQSSKTVSDHSHVKVSVAAASDSDKLNVMSAPAPGHGTAIIEGDVKQSHSSATHERAAARPASDSSILGPSLASLKGSSASQSILTKESSSTAPASGDLKIGQGYASQAAMISPKSNGAAASDDPRQEKHKFNWSKTSLKFGGANPK